MLPNQTLIFIACGCGLLLFWLSQRISSRKKFHGLPRVGIDPGLLGVRTRAAKAEFFARGQQLLEQAYAKVRSIPFSDESSINVVVALREIAISIHY